MTKAATAENARTCAGKGLDCIRGLMLKKAAEVYDDMDAGDSYMTEYACPNAAPNAYGKMIVVVSVLLVYYPD